MPAQTESICILDDDSSMRRSIKQLLDSDGLMALSFEDADVFLEHARSYPVPLAVLDVWMPAKSGLEVQARLKELSPNTRVIVITARATPQIRAAALEAGAFAFVLKPFDDETFLSLVREALDRST
jgi:FixJ family two-component response regulator